LCLAWGVRSVVTPDATQLEDMVDAAVATARKLDIAKTDDRIVVVAGIPPGRAGKTNTVRIVRLD
jgi:pyruvate kinase